MSDELGWPLGGNSGLATRVYGVVPICVIGPKLLTGSQGTSFCSTTTAGCVLLVAMPIE